MEFEREWARIKRPFVPGVDLPAVDFNCREYAVLALSSNDTDNASLVIYDDGETIPLSDIYEWLSSPTQNSDRTSTKAETKHQGGQHVDDAESSDTPEISEKAYDDPDTAIAAFVDACLCTADDGSLTPDEVYAAYAMWASNHDISVESKNWFARRLGDHIEFERETVYQDGKTTRRYTGLALHPEGKQ